ncbi:MAG: acetate/propionate family kinase, partial [Maioricimonas sp. JB049]
SGLYGLSGISPDLRDIEEAAAEGNERAELAINVFTADIKRYIGQYLAVLNGADAIVFTGGIGENSTRVRSDVCADMDYAGILLDAEKNGSAQGEAKVSCDDSRVEIWTVPTNEEVVVARQTVEVVSA